MDETNIKYFNTFLDKESGSNLCLNRSIKSRMFKYVTQTETRKWIDKLYDFFKGNNNSYH